jgi:peptidoglycan hydrolase CwlO-like protein
MAKKNKTIEDLGIMVAKGFNDLGDRLEKTATKDELYGVNSELHSAIDGLAKNVKDFQAELASNQTAHDRMQKYIESLDKRITKVELRTGIRTK